MGEVPAVVTGGTDRHFEEFVGSKEQDGPARGKDVLGARLSVEELKEAKKWAIKIHSLRYQNVCLHHRLPYDLRSRLMGNGGIEVDYISFRKAKLWSDSAVRNSSKY